MIRKIDINKSRFLESLSNLRGVETKTKLFLFDVVTIGDKEKFNFNIANSEDEGTIVVTMILLDGGYHQASFIIENTTLYNFKNNYIQDEEIIKIYNDCDSIIIMTER